MNGGMQCFDAAAKNFRRVGVIGNFGDRDMILAQKFGGAAGCEQCPTESGESIGKINETGFVVDRENGCGHGNSFIEFYDRLAVKQAHA